MPLHRPLQAEVAHGQDVGAHEMEDEEHLHAPAPDALHLHQVGDDRLVRHARGTLTEEGEQFVPEPERRKVVRSSRIYLGIILAVIAACILMQSVLPAMLIVLPRFYGAFISHLMNLALHAGLEEDVWDHRLNTRTVLLNPVLRFLYSNMNYHTEHHMFPMVPYHRLPALHAMIRTQCPKPYAGLWQVYREMIPTLFRQRTDPACCIRRALP